jgi:uncharacterized membrane protein YheB (UPF0754 family)
MNRRIYVFSLLLLFVAAAFAQTSTEEQKKKINSIKKDNSYLYAEITTNDQQTSLDMAEDMLNMEINKYIAEQKKLRTAENIVLRNREEVIESVSLPRGNMFRAFKYVKKDDILPAGKIEVRANTVKVDEKGNVIAAPVQPAISAKRTETYQRLLTLKKFAELPNMLKQLKQEGRIGEYAKYKELSSPEKYVLIIYNKEGNIEALLSDGASRSNLRTLQADDVKNYPGRGAFGVIVND